MSLSNAYDNRLATHYRAYRPPLHTWILERALPGGSRFANGADIGCGTGYSSLALARYCQQVVGIEPSQAMLDQTKPHPNITYLRGSAEDIPLADHSVDIITYAGTLFYTDIHRAAQSLHRVRRTPAVVIVYDFSVIFEPFIAAHKLVIQPENTPYNHYYNFAGVAGFPEETATVERIGFNVRPAELAHLLLSEEHLYKAYVARYNDHEPYDQLKNELLQTHTNVKVEADIFYTTYLL